MDEEEKERVIEGLKKRHLPEEQLAFVDEVIALDDNRKKIQTESDVVKSQINQLSKEVGDLFKQGKSDEAIPLKEKVAELKSQNEVMDAEMNTVKNRA